MRTETPAQVTRVTQTGALPARDRVVVEEPLEIRLNGKALSVTMRTPGADEELALGFLWSERIVTSLDEVRSIRGPLGPPGGTHVEVEVDETAVTRRRWTRSFASTSSCGICGIESLDMITVHGRVDALEGEPRIERRLLFTLPARMRGAQEVFGLTGGLHAAALFAPTGELLAIREDIGRHNALDKLIGWAVRTPDLDRARSVLLVSGRLSFELTAKALALGVPILAAVSAPSSLAVEVGLQHGMTIIGFLRDESANIYAGEERVA
jgi:FdhD protein